MLPTSFCTKQVKINKFLWENAWRRHFDLCWFMSVMTFCAYGLVITLCIPRRDWYQAKPSRMGILAWKRSNRLSSCLAYFTSSDFSSFSLSLTERNIAKGTADPRVSALTKVIAFKPYRSTQLVYSIKFKLSHTIQFQNLDQISASKSWPKIYFKTSISSISWYQG